MMRFILIELLGIFKAVRSCLFPQCCRFYPTCTVYAEEALRTRPPLRAVWMIFGRVLRCHPLHPGGYDPATP